MGAVRVIRGVNISAALTEWRECRQAFELYRQAAFEAAHEATNGVLLNRRGQAKGIDPWSLFIGSNVRAYAYASEELQRWWDEHPRQSFEAFEAGWTPSYAH
jgi:hypothetical protein